MAATIFGHDVMTIEFSVETDDARILTVDGELAELRAAKLDRWAS